MRDFVVLIINKQRHEIRGSHAFMMLADYLRVILGLCGTKIVCAEGDCGACTVLCYRPELDVNTKYRAINACIILVAQLDGAHIYTVEGLKENNKLTAIQQSLAQAHASQCGFCTPGFVMTITALGQRAQKALSEQNIKNHLTGNLCRCTGYENIIKAVQKLNLEDLNTNLEILVSKESNNLEPVYLDAHSQIFFAPTKLEQATRWLKINPTARILGSSTDLGVGINKNKINLTQALSLHRIRELYSIEKNNNIIKVGARVPLSDLRKLCMTLVPEFARFLNIFASPQIKNMATLVGNIANASPIADTLPFLMINQANVYVLSQAQARVIPIGKFLVGYKKLNIKPDELITHISFEIPAPNSNLRLYKISQRRDLDIATINAAFCCELDSNKKIPIIKNTRLALGGVADRVIRLSKSEKLLAGKELNSKLIEEALAQIQLEITPLDDLRGSAVFRRVLIDGLVRRYFQEIMGELHA